jgi:hypothetical protein
MIKNQKWLTHFNRTNNNRLLSGIQRYRKTIQEKVMKSKQV